MIRIIKNWFATRRLQKQTRSMKEFARGYSYAENELLKCKDDSLSFSEAIKKLEVEADNQFDFSHFERGMNCALRQYKTDGE